MQLINVTKSFRANETRRYILKSVSCNIQTGKKIGVLGRNGSGKTTFLRMLAGSEPLDSGEIRRDGRVSFPVGFAGTFHPDLTGSENVRFLANIYGMQPEETIAWVEDFCEIGTYFRMPVKTYSAGMFAKLTFATSFAIDFDYYLVDEAIETGDARFREKCVTAFEARLTNATLILVSQNLHTIRTFCDSGAVLDRGKLAFYDNIDDAFAHYEDILESGGI